jgi:Bacterial Ig-like domain (group 3)
MMRRWLGRFATTLALVCVSAFFAGASAADTAGTYVSLGQIGFGSIVVDDANSHVFVSGPTANEVLVFDLSGNLVKTLPNLYGAGAMVIHGSTLYVLERNTGTIESIDLATLTDTGPIASGLNMPVWLAFAGGKFWTAVNGQYGWAQLASVGLDGTVTVFSNTTYYSPDFATSPAAPDTLYMSENGLSPGGVYRFDVSSGSPVFVSSNPRTDQSNIQQLAVSPDATRVIPASGAPYNFIELNGSTLQNDGVVYPAQPYPSAVAVSPGAGGLLATGLNSTYNPPNISVFRLGLPQAVFTAATPSTSYYANVLPHGLALTADGSRLFAVTGDSRLWIFTLNLSGTSTNTSVSASPSPSGIGQSVTLTATVSPTDGGGSVGFYANDTSIAGCSARPVAAGGVATCTTSSLPQGPNAIKAVYTGDAQYFGSFGTTSTTVGQGQTTTTAYPAQLVKSKSGTYSTTLRATLTSYGAPLPGRTIAFSTGGTALCSAPTDSSGNATCALVVKSNTTYRSLQKNGYTASFGGDSQYLASSAQASVTG